MQSRRRNVLNEGIAKREPLFFSYSIGHKQLLNRPFHCLLTRDLLRILGASKRVRVVKSSVALRRTEVSNLGINVTNASLNVHAFSGEVTSARQLLDE